jgi:sterol desaturase/sphingolipid hydroxylase (fatty acid hydroxylase superfamily)
MEPLLLWKSAGVAAWVAFLLLGERIWPAAPRTDAPPRLAWLGGPARLARNAAFWVINGGVNAWIALPITAAAAALAPDWRPAWWSGWWALLLDLLALDLWIFWWHRANHEVPFFWRFHRVHHLDGFLDATSAGRFHAGEVILSALARAPVVFLLAVPLAHVLVFEALILAAAAFHHSNLRLAPAVERALSRAVVTPSIHWVHHHPVRRDTDSNYATVLSLWDPLFRTRSATRRAPDMAIGVEGDRERGFLALLARPFN